MQISLIYYFIKEIKNKFYKVYCKKVIILNIWVNTILSKNLDKKSYNLNLVK